MSEFGRVMMELAMIKQSNDNSYRIAQRQRLERMNSQHEKDLATGESVVVFQGSNETPFQEPSKPTPTKL